MKHYNKLIYVLVFLSFAFTTKSTNFNTDDILGVWLTKEGKGKVEIYKENNQYFGKIIWLKTPNNDDGTPKKDINNPNKSIRNNTIIGLTVVKNLQFDGNKLWENGKIYDPESGNTYSSQIKMINKNEVELTGYIGFSFIGRTETWTRVK